MIYGAIALVVDALGYGPSIAFPGALRVFAVNNSVYAEMMQLQSIHFLTAKNAKDAKGAGNE